MKTKKSEKKLSLIKQTVNQLNQNSAQQIKGGKGDSFNDIFIIWNAPQEPQDAPPIFEDDIIV